LTFVEIPPNFSSLKKSVTFYNIYQLNSAVCTLSLPLCQGSPLGITIPDGAALDKDLGVIHLTDDLRATDVHNAVKLWGDSAILATKVWGDSGILATRICVEYILWLGSLFLYVKSVLISLVWTGAHCYGKRKCNAITFRQDSPPPKASH
jgi:hypothetical protein